jgi:hypothetical protein
MRIDPFFFMLNACGCLFAACPGALHLQCLGNILCLRSAKGRTIGWAQAHFFVAAG